MLGLDQANDDDPGFLDLVDRLIAGALAVHGQEDARIFEVDNWFDHKWLRFSGKTLGALGIRKEPPTIPPFVANRLVRRWHFRRDDEGRLRLLGSGPEIHHRGWSGENLRRRVRQIVPTSSLFWFSGNTLASGRGSLMGYVPVGEELWTWFLGLSRDGDWKVSRRKNIHEYEVSSFAEAAERARVSQELV